ncbi:hypothetical protein I4U23_008888 [Adineta vaga]|nr:hypothetical protein I4U23_008888 [Adineta vaga]
MIVKPANLIAIQHDRIHDKLSSNDICIMFNQFLIEFERMEKSGHATTKLFLDAVEDIIDAVLSILPYKLLDPKVLNHPLMHFIQQLLITILDNWCISQLRINIQETDILLKIVLIFVHAAEQAFMPDVNENEKTKKDLLTTKQLLFKVREQIDGIVLNKQDSDEDPNVWAVGLLTIKLLQGSPFYYNLGRNQRLINDLIMNSLDSYDYRQIMLRLQHGQSLTDIDYFLFLTCWQYLSSRSLTKENFSISLNETDLLHFLVDELITRLEYAIDELLSIAPPSLAYIFERCHQLLTIHNLASFDKHANYIIDRLTHILQNQLTTNSQDQALIIVALDAFHDLTKTSDIRAIIKNRQLTSLFRNFTSTENNDQRKLAFGILAEIMDEQEINKNPEEMTTIFIDQLKQLDPKEYNPDLDNILSTIKVLIQHESPKNEIIKQGGLERIVSFIRDGDISKQSDNQLENALKILWLSTFDHPDVVKSFQEDVKFMTRVNQLLDHAKQNQNPKLEKAADGLIWKVEKEEKFKEQQQEKKKKKKSEQSGTTDGAEEDEEEEEEQYDLMISYSWADMDLAHRIFHHLTEKLGYKIWLDQEQMHGSTIEAMANAVDNAQFILMCMSETYKRSANCKSEAEYAFNRKKHIVPCKMKKDYSADGWLGFILGTRMYIDFETQEFEKAIELLDNEIQLQKKKRKEAKESTKTPLLDEMADKKIENTKVECQSTDNEIIERIETKNIASWTISDARDFLIKKDLLDILPLFEGINGRELFDLYSMCKINSVLMYRSLKSELLKMHDKVLTIATYLHFIDRLRTVCDHGSSLDTFVCDKQFEECVDDVD